MIVHVYAASPARGPGGQQRHQQKEKDMLSGPKRKALIQGCLCCLPELFLNLLIYSSICLPIKPLLSTYYVPGRQCHILVNIAVHVIWLLP